METRLHRALGRFRVHGEWFEDSPRGFEKVAEMACLRERALRDLTAT